MRMKTKNGLIKYVPLIKELVNRDLKVKYRRSILGYLWSMLNPLLMMMVLSYVFSSIFLSSIPNFVLYLICGQTLWNCFNESTSLAMYSILQNGTLIKKVYLPKLIFPIARVTSSFVTMAFSLLAVLVVMIFTRTPFAPSMLLFWFPLLLLYIFSIGVGLILSSLAVFFRDITHLYSVLTLAWMYATPVFYDTSILPEDVQQFIRINPMASYITFFRELILYGRIPQLTLWHSCIAASIIAFVLGLIIFKKLEKRFILCI